MQSNDIMQACNNMINQKLRELSMAQSKCTIFRVHAHLRNINDKAYDPEVIAIGPYHRDKDNLKMMEDYKLHCFSRLLQRKNQNADTYVSAIGPLERKARKCYANPISLDATEFIEMLIVDGCFIIELVKGENDDSFFHMDWLVSSLHRDLMLFENQIPFFVLCELFHLVKVPNDHSTLTDLLTEYYRPIYPGRMSSNRSSHEIKHLLGLIHINLISSFNWSVLGEEVKDKRKRFRFVGSATTLREANVKFESNKGGSLFDIRFKHGTMSLPPLNVEDRTESFLRNLIAYEQYFHDTETSYVTDYVMFFDCLINSSRDVQVLSHAGIIKNSLGDDEVVADVFNKLTDSVVIGHDDKFVYAEIFDKVNEHCNKNRNRWMAKLRRDYLNSPWAIISIIAAVVLIVLTVAQTVFSALQVF